MEGSHIKAKHAVAALAVCAVAIAPSVSGAATINGNGRDNILDGTKYADTIKARGGKDTVTARNGNDKVFGGAGSDHVAGADGNDRVSGGTGDDEVDGGPGDDVLYGGPGNESNNGRDITGDAGNDVIYPGDGTDFVYGEEGFNHIIVTDDGVYDQLFCSFKSDTRRGRLTYIGGRDTKDGIGVNFLGVPTCEVDVVTDRVGLRALKRSLPDGAWFRSHGRSRL